MNLVLIHGRSQTGRDETELRFYWMGCLDRAWQAAGLPWPSNIKVVFPFYANVLDDMVRQRDQHAEALSRGETPIVSEETLRLEMLREILAARGVSERELPVSSDEPLERGLQNSNLVLAMLQLLDSTPMGGSALNALTRDVFLYLTIGAVQTKVNEIVSQAFEEGTNIVVAHSLGSIVAYQVLAEPSMMSYNVSLLLTLGSPLGIRAIANRLSIPIVRPAIVSEWVNARDPRDVVALNSIECSGQSPDCVEDYSLVRNLTGNHHSIDGYLADPFVASRLHYAASAD